MSKEDNKFRATVLISAGADIGGDDILKQAVELKFRQTVASDFPDFRIAGEIRIEQTGRQETDGEGNTCDVWLAWADSEPAPVPAALGEVKA